MLRIKDDEAIRNFFVIDAHHHIGEDVDGNENVPIGNSGSYELSRSLEEEVIGALKDSDIVSYNEVVELFDPDIIEESHPYGLFDQFVVFPMKDKFRNEGEIPFSKSNKNIARWVNADYHGRRLIGFGRVDPSEIDKARKEVKKFPDEYGLVGLKIHPDSERFHLDSKEVIQLYVDCARMGLPIIFHTGYPSDVEDIHEGINKTISLLVENGKEELVSQLNVIAGHCSYVDEEVFRYLSHPCIYGEMSTLSQPEEFIRAAKENIALSNFTNVTLNDFKKDVSSKLKSDFWKIFQVNSHWSSKIMLGTDHPFLPKENIVKLFEALFSSDLAEELEPRSIQNILGKNLVDILPSTVGIHVSTSRPE
ncbi:MAG: amidohydrolase family protein [Candidatus Aenigmatarchaeota archaeon]